MIYHGTYAKETIVVHPNNDERNYQFIDIIKDANMPIFFVQIEDDGDLWTWNFQMINNSDYERVKLNIMETIFKINNMKQLIEILDNIFTDGFADILINDTDENNVGYFS